MPLIRSYPDDGPVGVECTGKHTHRLPQVLLEVHHLIDEFADQWADGEWPFVFSNGNRSPWGSHGDLINVRPPHWPALTCAGLG